jgi:hypothetical protein
LSHRLWAVFDSARRSDRTLAVAIGVTALIGLVSLSFVVPALGQANSVGDIAPHSAPDLHASHTQPHSAQPSLVRDYLD